MKLILDRKQLKSRPEQFLRQAGYSYIRDQQSGQDSYARRLSSGRYPRLHLYIKEQNNQRHSEAGKIILNIHLDQKQASYEGAHAHSAEYEGEIVNKEIKRLKELLDVSKD